MHLGGGVVVCFVYKYILELTEPNANIIATIVHIK